MSVEQSAVTWRADDDGPDSPARYVGWALAAAGVASVVAVFVRPEGGVFLGWLGIVAFGAVVDYLAGSPERNAIVGLRLESNRLTAWWADDRVASYPVGAVSEVTWTTVTDHPWQVSMVLTIDGRRRHTRSSLESRTRILRALSAAGVTVTFEEPFVMPATTM